MNPVVKEVLERLRQRGLLPSIPEEADAPLPAINKVELYPTFRCNDRCEHCVTQSGPEMKESLSPDEAGTVVRNIAEFSVVNRSRALFGEGRLQCQPPRRCSQLAAMEHPPKILTDSLLQDYAHCIQGRGTTCKWGGPGGSFDLNFSRPSIRISGGEFFMWPPRTDGKELSWDQRLPFQTRLLEQIRYDLPDYDIWILTNGRFATSQERADVVMEHWGERAVSPNGRGTTRVCISTDVFHRSPQNSTIQEMLERIFAACRKHSQHAPFLYGIVNHTIAYLGRAFDRFKVGTLDVNEIRNASGIPLNPAGSITVDPIDLVEREGCREVKGFWLQHGSKVLISNDIVVSPSGRLAYCCACLGDYGDFLREPGSSLRRIAVDPISVMLRRKETVIDLLTTAVQVDPSISICGTYENAAVTGSTCYQMMTGVRLPVDSD